MRSAKELSDFAKFQLDKLIDDELLGDTEPSTSLHGLDDNSSLALGSSEFMVPYLNTQLEARGSHLRVEQVETYYFDFSPLGGILGRTCHLGLVDSAAGTRRLFTFGPYQPALKWWREQTSGPAFERSRQRTLGVRRQEALRNRVPDAVLEVLAPITAIVRAYVETRELTADQAYDLADRLKYTPWDKMKLEDLVYIALALDTTLTAILAEEPAQSTVV